MSSNKWLVLPLLVTALVFAPAPVSADFHSACTGFATAYANVGLLANVPSGDLQYSAVVNCPGAVVTIKDLALRELPAAGFPVLVSQIAGAACASSPCTLANETAAGTGRFEVRMLFDVDDPDTPVVDYKNVPRRAVWDWSGTGQPVLRCTSIGFFPVYAGSC